MPSEPAGGAPRTRQHACLNRLDAHVVSNSIPPTKESILVVPVDPLGNPHQRLPHHSVHHATMVCALLHKALAPPRVCDPQRLLRPRRRQKSQPDLKSVGEVRDEASGGARQCGSDRTMNSGFSAVSVSSPKSVHHPR